MIRIIEGNPEKIRKEYEHLVNLMCHNGRCEFQTIREPSITSEINKDCIVEQCRYCGKTIIYKNKSAWLSRLNNPNYASTFTFE